MATFIPCGSASAPVLLAVNLRAGGEALLEEIESACGKSLRIQYEDMEPRGRNEILSDGTPFVRINPNYASILEELIVHELSHLQLALNG